MDNGIKAALYLMGVPIVLLGFANLSKYIHDSQSTSPSHQAVEQLEYATSSLNQAVTQMYPLKWGGSDVTTIHPGLAQECIDCAIHELRNLPGDLENKNRIARIKEVVSDLENLNLTPPLSDGIVPAEFYYRETDFLKDTRKTLLDAHDSLHKFQIEYQWDEFPTVGALGAIRSQYYLFGALMISGGIYAYRARRESSEKRRK